MTPELRDKILKLVQPNEPSDDELVQQLLDKYKLLECVASDRAHTIANQRIDIEHLRSEVHVVSGQLPTREHYFVVRDRKFRVRIEGYNVCLSEMYRIKTGPAARHFQNPQAEEIAQALPHSVWLHWEPKA